MKNRGICIVSHTNDLSGANRALVELATGISKAYENVWVVIPRDGKIVEELKKNQINYKILGYTSWIDNRKSVLKKIIKICINFIMQFRFIFFCLYNHIGLVHYNSSAVGVGYRLLRLFKIPYVYHIREFIDNNCVRYHSFSKAKKAFNKANRLIAISNSVKKKCSEIGIKGNWLVISDGIPRKESKIYDMEDYKNVIIVGGIEKNKGQYEAIKAVNELKNQGFEMRLYIVGPIMDTLYYNTIMNYIDEHCLDEVILLGETSDVDSIRERCGIALVCSKYEAFGRVTAEAMSIGEIVIGANTGATAEIIQDGYNGILYDVDSIKDLCMKIRYVITNRDKIRNMLNEAKKIVDTEYSEQRCINKVSELYRQIML